MPALADWLRDRTPAYERSRRLSLTKRRALRAIQTCRTPARGGSVYRCTQCAKTHFAYHSCHHRNCPRCGGARTQQWTARLTGRLLPVPYFMVTVTVPEALREAFLAEPKAMIDILFTQAAAALQDIAAIPRHLGAQLGMTGVLHTWGRQMQYHPHLHLIVPGGGLRKDGRKWRKTRRPDWMLPAAAVAARVRARFEQAMQDALPHWHAKMPDSTWRRAWVLDIRAVGSGKAAVKYLARYVCRSAISDERILSLSPQQVRFAYRDCATNQRKVCTLSADEFIRRYLQHVLPPGSHRIRHYGWEHPAAHRRRRKVETILEVPIIGTSQEPSGQWHLLCPHCHTFTLVCIRALPQQPRAPPALAA